MENGQHTWTERKSARSSKESITASCISKECTNASCNSNKQKHCLLDLSDESKQEQEDDHSVHDQGNSEHDQYDDHAAGASENDPSDTQTGDTGANAVTPGQAD